MFNGPGFNYTLFTFNLTAPGASTDLQVSRYSPPNALTLDDVSVTDVTPAGVPGAGVTAERGLNRS